jgi:hypothetical protein
VKTHDLKTWPRYFGAVMSGAKTFEARKDDRDFEVGDRLMLREWDAETAHYTGAALERYVTYILRGTEHVAPGYCILALGIHP